MTQTLTTARDLAAATAATSYTRSDLPWAGAYGQAKRLAREAGIPVPDGFPTKPKAAALCAAIEAHLAQAGRAPAPSAALTPIVEPTVIETSGVSIDERAAAAVPPVPQGFVASDRDAAVAAAGVRLAQVLRDGMRKTGPVIDRLLSSTPQDALVPASAARFELGEHVPALFARDQQFGGPLHSHAFGQLSARVGLPTAYAQKLAGGEPWERDLLSHAMGEHLSHSEDRFLVRAVDGTVRGILSDSYRRLDSRPLLDAFVTACKDVGAQPFEGVASDIRASVRVIVPRIYEPVPGEAMVFGLAWNNSDFGAGAFGISAFVLRLICLNGMVGASEIKKIHLGSRLQDLSLSQATYDLDTRTLASATSDIVRGVLTEGAIENRLDLVRRAHSQETDWAKAVRRVSSTLSKSEQSKVREAFEGNDTVMLPPGQTLWRFSNALSWVANSTENPDRKLELQGLAGAVVA